jgi:hypothetical protein
VEGPFAANRIFCSALAAITGRDVLPSSAAGGTTRGAVALLAPEQTAVKRPDRPMQPLGHPALAAYAKEWRNMA